MYFGGSRPLRQAAGRVRVIGNLQSESFTSIFRPSELDPGLRRSFMSSGPAIKSEAIAYLKDRTFQPDSVSSRCVSCQRRDDAAEELKHPSVPSGLGYHHSCLQQRVGGKRM